MIYLYKVNYLNDFDINCINIGAPELLAWHIVKSSSNYQIFFVKYSF